MVNYEETSSDNAFRGCDNSFFIWLFGNKWYSCPEWVMYELEDEYENG
jgi:hypothetical protein